MLLFIAKQRSSLYAHDELAEKYDEINYVSRYKLYPQHKTSGKIQNFNNSNQQNEYCEKFAMFILLIV